MKAWFSDFESICKAVICHRFLSWSDGKCQEYNWGVLIAASLFIFALIGGGITGGGWLLKYALNNIEKGKFTSSEPTENPASLITPTHQNRYVEKVEAKHADCDLSSGTWDLWLGDLNRDIRDGNHLSLPLNANQGLYKYSKDFNIEWTCEFAFVPRGDKVVNYVISFDGVYQIVIGDNDYWTIALRASDAIGDPLVPIKEEKTQRERPRLLSMIKPGSTVKATLKQKFVDQDNYRVELAIDYDRDVLTQEISKEPETFAWTFKPSPDMEIGPQELSIGLIRARGDTSHIGASFLYPDPDIQKEKSVEVTPSEPAH